MLEFETIPTYNIPTFQTYPKKGIYFISLYKSSTQIRKINNSEGGQDISSCWTWGNSLSVWYKAKILATNSGDILCMGY